MKHWSHLIFILLMMNFLGSCAVLPIVMIGGATAVGGYYLGKDERSAKRIAIDTTITAEINAEFLADDAIQTFDINVDTYRGVVTLKGKVPSLQTKDKVLDIAENIDGVIEVIDALSVEEADPTTEEE